MRRLNKALGFIAGFGVALAASVSHASIINGNGSAIAGYTGSEPFFTTTGGSTLSVHVDYAVFAPGVFGGLGLGVDPSAGSDYVYTYLANVDSATNVLFSDLTVGLASGSGAHNAANSTSIAGAVPSTQVILSSSFVNLWSSGIAAGNSSDIVMFTSPNPPTFDSASVSNGGLSDQERLPSPTVPEPASIGLLAVAGLLGLARRRI